MVLTPLIPGRPYPRHHRRPLAALVHYNPLTGNMEDRLELHCTIGRGVPIIRATLDCSLSSLNYLDDLDEKFAEQLVLDWILKDELTHLFTLQVTIFRCGGYVVGAALYHSFCDGLGGSLAELAHGAESLTIKPIWDC